jgi:hypothetical protein
MQHDHVETEYLEARQHADSFYGPALETDPN